MKREDRIFAKLEEICAKKYKNVNWKNIKRTGLSAQELSEILKVDRANISKDLNQLVKQGKVVKFTGRPTLFFTADMIRSSLNIEIKSYEVQSIDEIMYQLEKDFSHIIGLQGSLKTCFEQLHVAVLYPPFGLHTLLYGGTGVGKSMLADLMYSIAQKEKPEKFKSYMTFNCADYSQNTNLLMAELFGCIKGAYTGADTARKGIIENADNGILFLDEVHRLPPEGQEMLFYVMDKGMFRRVGEAKEYTRVNILIICATTEKPETVLLPTFFRRIPMKIYVPNYSDRPVEERKRLVEFYFSEECRILNKTFKLEKQIVDVLSMYNCKGNVGQLKNDIKLMSARAFAQTITNDENIITLSYEDAEKAIGPTAHKASKKNMPKEYILLNGTRPAERKVAATEDDVYENLLNTLNELSLQNYSKQEIEKSMNDEINRYFKVDSKNRPDNDTINRFVEPEMIELSLIVLELAKTKLNKNYDNSNLFTLSLHLKATIHRLKNSQTIKNKKINDISLRKKYSEEFMVALEAAEKIEKKISVSIPLNEVGFLTLFLVSIDIDTNNTRVGILVACHGDNIASSMLDLANKILGKDVGQALDIPLEKGFETTIAEIIAAVKKADEGKGVLILIDMGLVSNVRDMIIARSGVQVEVIEKVSTPMLIRALEKSQISDSMVQEFYKDILTDYYQDTVYYETPKSIKNEKNIIIIYCLTGKGTALRLKEFIFQNMANSLLDKMEIHIEDEDFIHLSGEQIQEKYDNRILVFIGTFKSGLQDIPYISAEEILLQDGITRLTAMVENVEGYNPYKEGEISLSKVLKFVNPILLVKELKKLIPAFENQFNTSIDPKIVAILILHLGCMVEDLILGKKLEAYDIDSQLYQQYATQMRCLGKLFKPIENLFNLSIPDSELARITELIMKN